MSYKLAPSSLVLDTETITYTPPVGNQIVLDVGAPTVWPPNVPTGIVLNAELPFVLPDPVNVRFVISLPGKISLTGTLKTESPSCFIVAVKDMASDNIETTLPADDGSYSIDVTDFVSVLVLAVQNPGRRFFPEAALQVGDVVRPAQFEGWVYEVIEAGQAPSSEPHWWLPVDGDKGAIGTARARVVPYVQPRVHGPVTVER